MEQTKGQPAQDTKLHFLDYWRIIRIRKTVILAVFALVVMTSTLVTLVGLEKKYQSTAKIKVERDQTDISGLQSPYQAISSPYDPYFIQTEFEVIQSELILSGILESNIAPNGVRPVLVKDVYRQRYGASSKTDLLMMLRRNLDVRPTRNTSLIEIRVESPDPDEAAAVANCIAVAYKNYRVEERQRLTSGGIAALTNRIDEISKQVHAAQSNLQWLRVELKIPDAFIQADTPTPLFTQEALRHYQQLRIEGERDLEKSKQMLEALKARAKDPAALAQAIPTTGLQDNNLNELLQQLSLANQKYVTLTKEFGPSHSEVMKVTAQMEALRKDINDRVAGAIDGLDMRVQASERDLATMIQGVEKAKQEDIEQANRSRPYWEAKRNLDELQMVKRALYTKMETETTDLKLPKTAMVEITDYAHRSDRPSSPKTVLNITLGVIIGLIVGIGLAFFIEYLDTSVKTIDDVERSLGSPVLGVIPQNVGILIDEGAESPHAEAYRVLRTNLLFSRKDDKLNTVAVVSAGAGEGKSTTVFNLATIFAQSGQRVLVVDSDLRRPTLHKMMKVTNNLGLTNYLLKQNTLEEVIQTSSVPTLDFMASGKLPSSSLGILSSAQMRDLIAELKLHYDFIFFDSPPVMGVSDASILASEVDMTLQVIQYRRYPQPMNIRAKQLIEKVGGNLVGIVLNNINMSQDESYYYYSGYYHENYSRSEDAEPASESGRSA